MNIFDIYLDKITNLIKKLKAEGLIELPESLNGLNVDIPPSNFDCDISTNVSMVLSKINKKSPTTIANQLINLIEKDDPDIELISVAKPGFINIKFKGIFWNNFIKEVHNNYKIYGVNVKEKKQKYLIEFVSANPTGPLHVGHCRGAILGDVISNILIFNKHRVFKEYYVNDYGNQIINFTKSVYFRVREILFKEKFPLENADLYPGDYLIDIAKNIIKKNIDLNFNKFENISKELTLLSVSESLKLIKSNLENLGIVHDNFISETSIVHDKEVEKVIINLKDKNLIYEGKIKAPTGANNDKWVEREQLLFKSTEFGDDKDRALQKSDKSWTYFASDVAYHNNKLDRNFDILINILGADHAGYIKRITSVVEALSESKNKLICKVSQLVKLIKNGKPFKMSKRKGDYITVEDLISEVGKDATRFIMLNRSSDVELDFDFAKGDLLEEMSITQGQISKLSPQNVGYAFDTHLIREGIETTVQWTVDQDYNPSGQQYSNHKMIGFSHGYNKGDNKNGIKYGLEAMGEESGRLNNVRVLEANVQKKTSVGYIGNHDSETVFEISDF